MTDRPDTQVDSVVLHDIGELLAHALEMEHEAVLRYHQLADSLELHHNQQAAALFRELAARNEVLATAIGDRARGIALPRIAPWAFKWNCPHGPKAGDCLDERIGYQMTARQALELALHNETRGHAFYAGVAAADGNDVATLAAELGTDQRAHLDWLRTWLARLDESSPPPAEDFDPPNVTA